MDETTSKVVVRRDVIFNETGTNSQTDFRTTDGEENTQNSPEPESKRTRT